MSRMRTTAVRSTTVPAPLPPPLGGPEDDVRVGSSGGERRVPGSEARARGCNREALKCLAALGVTPMAARELVAEHGTHRVVDALDAVATLADGEVRLRAGWVLSAVREGWDLDELLAERRTAAARLARWQAERADRDRDTSRWRSRESLRGEWRGAISAALDDRQLATAVARITTPVAGLGRRSVPIVRAQLVAWAVAAHHEAPTRSLSDVLADDLVGTKRLVSAPSLEGPIPAVAGVGTTAGDLTARLTELLASRADLAMPGPEDPERAHAGLRRSLGDGLGRER
jgi:hypothetical protein